MTTSTRNNRSGFFINNVDSGVTKMDLYDRDCQNCTKAIMNKMGPTALAIYSLVTDDIFADINDLVKGIGPKRVFPENMARYLNESLKSQHGNINDLISNAGKALDLPNISRKQLRSMMKAEARPDDAKQLQHAPESVEIFSME